MRTSAPLVIFCVALLSVAFLSNADMDPDTDLDGIPDSQDNCLLVPNGPLASTYSCDDQEDGDMDGYGNPCDTDFNNNGATDLPDLLDVFLASSLVSTDNVYDIGCRGSAGFEAVNQTYNDQIAVKAPGPSGLACAGSIPCP